jgi:hypothetical protein
LDIFFRETSGGGQKGLTSFLRKFAHSLKLKKEVAIEISTISKMKGV